MKKQLVKLHDYHAVHIGDPVKKVARAFDLSQEQVDGALKDEPTRMLRGMTPRQAVLESISEELDRHSPHLIDDLGAQKALMMIAHGKSPVLIDGVRTAEQAAAVRKIGAKIVRVDRGREPNRICRAI